MITLQERIAQALRSVPITDALPEPITITENESMDLAQAIIDELSLTKRATTRCSRRGGPLTHLCDLGECSHATKTARYITPWENA